SPSSRSASIFRPGTEPTAVACHRLPRASWVAPVRPARRCPPWRCVPRRGCAAPSPARSPPRESHAARLPMAPVRYASSPSSCRLLSWRVARRVRASLVGWLAQHYATESQVLVLAAVLATAVGTFAVVWVNRLAYHRIEQLEDL